MYFQAFDQEIHYLDEVKSAAIVSGKYIDTLRQNSSTSLQENVRLRTDINALITDLAAATRSLNEWKAKCA